MGVNALRRHNLVDGLILSLVLRLHCPGDFLDSLFFRPAADNVGNHIFGTGIALPGSKNGRIGFPLLADQTDTFGHKFTGGFLTYGSDKGVLVERSPAHGRFGLRGRKRIHLFGGLPAVIGQTLGTLVFPLFLQPLCGYGFGCLNDPACDFLLGLRHAQSVEFAGGQIHKAVLNGGLLNFCVSGQHPVEHSPHLIVQLNVEHGELTVDLREPLAEPGKRLFQYGTGCPALAQVGLPGAGQFLILPDSPAGTGVGTDIGAQLPVVFLHRLIGKAILHGPLHLEKADMPHLVGQRGQAGSFEELYNELPCPHRNAPGR